ncbi:hypothetical protein QZH41_009843, partial [Actinostola sp. cb2023]
PDKGTKRKKGHDEGDSNSHRKKASYLVEEKFSSGGTELTDEEREKILEMVENEPEVETLDVGSLRRMLLSFEKKVTKNQEMRIKYPDHPEKFMESELDLHEEIQKLHVIATAPELYQHIVNLNAITTMLGLISHDNTGILCKQSWLLSTLLTFILHDITVGIVNLLQEMTDIDTLNESEDGATALIDALLEGQIIALLVQNLERLDETLREENEGVHNSLGIIENMTELRDSISITAGVQGLMGWLIKRLKQKPAFNANKLYSSEIMSILIQNTEENRQLLGELNGIDTLLQCLSLYKRYDPATSDETEYMENLFNCLCSALMFHPNKDLFLKGEGLQLMILMLRKETQTQSSFCSHQKLTKRLEQKKNIMKFKPFVEHALSVMASLFKNLSGSLRNRLVQKFVEGDHIKVDRLMELHFKYYKRVQDCDERIDKEKQELIGEGEEIDEDMEDTFYLKRLDAGLFALQLVDCVMLEVCCSGVPSIKQHVLALLNQHGGSMKDIKSVMRGKTGIGVMM